MSTNSNPYTMSVNQGPISQVLDIAGAPDSGSTVGLKLQNGECLLAVVRDVNPQTGLAELYHPFIVMIGQGQVAFAPWLILEKDSGSVIVDLVAAGLVAAFAPEAGIRDAYRKSIGEVVIERASPATLKLVN